MESYKYLAINLLEVILRIFIDFSIVTPKEEIK